MEGLYMLLNLSQFIIIKGQELMKCKIRLSLYHMYHIYVSYIIYITEL